MTFDPTNSFTIMAWLKIYDPIGDGTWPATANFFSSASQGDAAAPRSGFLSLRLSSPSRGTLTRRRRSFRSVRLSGRCA